MGRGCFGCLLYATVATIGVVAGIVASYEYCEHKYNTLPQFGSEVGKGFVRGVVDLVIPDSLEDKTESGEEK